MSVTETALAMSPLRITSHAAASTTHNPAASSKTLGGRLEKSPWRCGMPAYRGVVMGKRRTATYCQGQDHPATANDIAISAAPPATMPPPNLQRRLPTISNGMGRNRLYLMRHKLSTHPAAKCLPRNKRASDSASTGMRTTRSRPMKKQCSSGMLQHMAMAAIHRRGAGQKQEKNQASAQH